MIEWLDDVRRRGASPDLEAFLGLRFEVPRATAFSQTVLGTWWHVAFGRATDGRVLALRAQPGRDWSEWPVVVLNGPHAVTLVGDRSAALPMWLYMNRLRFAAEVWDGVRKAWPRVGVGLAELQQAIGGAGEPLPAFERLLFDDARRDVAARTPERPRDGWAADSAMQRIVDPSPPTLAHLDYLDAVLVRRDRKAPPPETGVWTAATSAVACAAGKIVKVPDLGERARARWREPESLDNVFGPAPNYFIWPPPKPLSRPPGLDVAEILVQAGTGDDPLLAAAAAVHQAGARYDGLAHVEAAAALDEAGRADDAWNALQSAAWWSYVRFEAAIPAILDAARAMAERHGWAEIEGHLERMIEVRERGP